MKHKFLEKKYYKKMLMILTFCAAFILSGNMKKVQAAEWYDNYDYILNSSAKTITLKSSKGTLGATATVPGSATINGVSYSTVLDNSGSAISIWDADKSNLTSLTIQDGVKVAAGCRYLFYNLNKLKMLDVSGLDTSDMTNMSDMFNGCSELLYLDLSNFNTEKVTNMVRMFNGCKKIIYIDVSGFNTQQVNEMDYMFGGSFGGQMLQDLDLRSFYLSQGTSTFAGFLKESAIVNIYLPKSNCIKNYDFSVVNKLARIYFEGTETEWKSLNNTYANNVKIIYNYTQKNTPSEPQVSNPDTTTWYNDYNYYLDKKNYKLIIMSSKGNGITSAVIPAYTSIGGNIYKTVLNNYYARKNPALSLWANDINSLKEIKIADGVEVVDECSGLFRFNKQKVLTTLSIGALDTSNVVYMDYMFANISIKNLDLRNMDMSNASTSNMFTNSSITNLYLPENAMKGYDLSSVSGLKNVYYKGDSTHWAALGNTLGTIKITNDYTGAPDESTTITVSFNANGGTCSKKSITVNINESYGTLPTPKRDGYSFKGWYTEKTGGTQITEKTTVDTSINHTLYAQWAEDKNEKDKKEEMTSNTVTISKQTIVKNRSVISSLKQTKKGRKLKVKYNKFKGATGYQIQYSTSKKFKKKTTIKVKKTTAITKKLKKGKRYYVRVRAYIKSGKKYYYSKWSDIKRSSKIK